MTQRHWKRAWAALKEMGSSNMSAFEDEKRNYLPLKDHFSFITTSAFQFRMLQSIIMFGIGTLTHYTSSMHILNFITLG